MNISPIYWWREMMGLRRCDTLPEFARYVTKKLKTPDKVAAYISNTIFYVVEDNPAWFPIEKALRDKEGNCTEISALGVYALRALGYRAENLCLYGVDKATGQPAGHAVCAFEHAGRRGWIEGGVVRCYSDLPWQTLIPHIRKDWRGPFRFGWKNERGEPVKGFGL